MQKIFFQSSLPRSGSTLLQNILAHNPTFYATPTSPLADYLVASREVFTNNPAVNAQDENEMKKAIRGYCKNGLYGYFNNITDKQNIIDKSRTWLPLYDYLEFILEEKPKVICLIRDLRDIFASNEKNYRKNPHKARQNFGMGDANTLPKRIDVWAASNNFTGNSIDSINDSIRTGLSANVLFIKYESLCLYPDDVMNMIYNYLQIPIFKHDFENINQMTKEDDTFHGIFGDHKIRKRLEMNNSDAKVILGNDICDWIYNNYKWFYEHFGYSY